jgi:hypothetical protein
MTKGYYFNIDNTCIYCDKQNRSEHFLCGGCGVGMCEDCYSHMIEHTEHCFDFHESLDDKPQLYSHIAKETGFDYGYMCYACIDRFAQQIDNK